MGPESGSNVSTHETGVGQRAGHLWRPAGYDTDESTRGFAVYCPYLPASALVNLKNEPFSDTTDSDFIAPLPRFIRRVKNHV